MNQPRSSLDCFPLLPRDPGIWDSLDKPTREKVLDCLSLLMLQHLRQTPRCSAEEQPLTKGHST
jgi:hypothetical protein